MNEIKPTYETQDALENKPIIIIQASFFSSFFSNPENFVDLYKFCSNKDLDPATIEYLKLDSPLLTRHMANDVAFITADDRLIILVEHSSSNNPNMPQRFLLYYAEYIRIWLSKNDIELSGTKKVKIPTPEFYVAYTGLKKFNEKNLTFEPNEYIKIKADFLDMKYEKLQNKDVNNAVAGYTFFIETYYNEIFKGKSREEAFITAQKETKKRGYLSDIIDKEEFMLAYKPIIDIEADMMQGGLEAGIEIGMGRGMGIGMEKGMEKGIGIGRKEGIGIGAIRMLFELTKPNLDDLKNVARKYNLSDKQLASIISALEDSFKKDKGPNYKLPSEISRFCIAQRNEMMKEKSQKPSPSIEKSPVKKRGDDGR